jgi:predicted transposase/invertase (TIGR01784 family)
MPNLLVHYTYGMETDSFFYQLFSQLPQIFFELIGEPPTRAKSYRFDSVELKKAFRIDGLFLPRTRKLPVYFAEVQFQRRQRFYANVFAKVFCYLHENDPKQEWIAVAIFPTRNEEPTHLGPYEDLLGSKRVKRIYLEDIANAKNPPVGLALLQLLFATEKEAELIAPRVVAKAKTDFGDSDLQAKLVELVERLLMTRFTGLSLEEMRMKFKLHDIRQSKAWQQLREEALKEGAERASKRLIESLLASGMTKNEIGQRLKMPLSEVERLTKVNSH